MSTGIAASHAVVALCVWLLLVDTGLARTGGPITEDDVVNILDGEKTSVSAAVRPGFSFSMALTPQRQQAILRGTFGVSTQEPGDEEFYRRLIPVGRALESPSLKPLRFVIKVYAESHGVEDPHGQLALQVAEALKRFLTTHFAIQGDRLRIQREASSRLATAMVKTSKGGPRWRVEIIAAPIASTAQ